MQIVSGPAVVVAALGLGLMATTIGWAGELVEVPPGAVVRWPGEGVERCGMLGRKWAPLEDGCWYPIDLLTAAGELSLARWREGTLEERRVRVADYPYEVQHLTVDDSQVDLSAEDLARVRSEQQRVGALWGLDTPRAFRLPLLAPLEALPAGGRFGARRFFNRQPRSPHSGADYAAPEGTPVRAVAAGRVALADDLFFSGRSVFVDHGDGLVSMYFHLNKMAVEEGDRLERGALVGWVGQTGRATGPHLHFGLRWRRARIDPALMLAPEAAPEVR